MIRSIIILIAILLVVVGTAISASLPGKKSKTRAEPLKCYDCSCTTSPCICNNFDTVTSEDTYCTIILEYYGQQVTTTFGHVDRDSTRVHIRDLPYVLVEESIVFSDQLGIWNTKTNIVLYGCDWDSCNKPDLVQYVPKGFQMRLPETWLNSSVLGNKQTIRNCHHCPDTPQCGPESFLDADLCPVQACNTTCIVSDAFDDPSKDEQCYQSYCATPEEDLKFDPHRVELEGILYLDKDDKTVELWEIDIYCRADDCSRPEIFNEVREKLDVQLGDSATLEYLKPTTSTATTINMIFNKSLLSLALFFTVVFRY
uniref:ArkB_3 n=1 Tax=Philodina roseola TaxID=96448 RepID=B2L3I3_PHIRO|nr:ArkB_4 [Philodina roseola]ACC43978.1 ArkB_3 [Philodina roseola]